MSGSVEIEYDLWCPCYDSDGTQADGDSDDDTGGVVAAPAPPRPPGLPDGYDTWEEYKKEQDRKAEHAKKDAEKKKEAEEKKKKEAEEKKKEAEDKKKEAEEKKKEAEEKKKEAEEKRKQLENKRQEAEEKRKKLQEERKEANAKRDAMLAKIADAKAARRAKILADAAIARVKFKKPAPNATAACDLAFAAMPSVNSSEAFCNATETSASSGRRRRILNTEYDVTIEVNPEEVNVTTAVTELQSGGITPTTTQVDPLVALASVDGVDSGDLTALKTEVAGAAEVQAEVVASEEQGDATEDEVEDIEDEVEDIEAEAEELDTEAEELDTEADGLEAEADELGAEAEYADQVADEEKKKADDAADTVSALPPRSDDEADVDIIYTTKPKGGAAGLAGLFTALVATAAALVSVGQIG